MFFEAAAPDHDRASYVRILQRLDGLMARFPRIRWLLVIAPPIQYYAAGGTWDFPEIAAKLYGRDTVWLEMSHPITWGASAPTGSRSKRLRAIPGVATCVPCQEEMERVAGQRR